jgi:hypothetical protein
MLTTEQQIRVDAARATRNLTCGSQGSAEPCNHSDDEHDAFDLGIADGEAGINKNPFTDLNLSEAWESGHSVASQMPRVTSQLFGH